MSDPKYEVVELSSLKVEEGAHELFDSPEMKPYADFLMAAMTGQDVKPSLDVLRRLPLEKRYLWRIASALKWGFADFDTENVAVDKRTLDAADFAKVMDLLKLRPIQFCMLIASLVGTEQMERTMLRAIELAKPQ